MRNSRGRHKDIMGPPKGPAVTPDGGRQDFTEAAEGRHNDSPGTPPGVHKVAQPSQIRQTDLELITRRLQEDFRRTPKALRKDVNGTL